jgi:integrase
MDRREMRFQNAAEIMQLAEAMAERYRTMVLVGGYCGLRFGETAGLQMEHFDELRRSRAVVTTITETAGKVIEGAPKTASSVRKVALPQFLVRELSEHIARWSDPDGWIFPSPEGGPIRQEATGFLWNKRRVTQQEDVNVGLT